MAALPKDIPINGFLHRLGLYHLKTVLPLPARSSLASNCRIEGKRLTCSMNPQEFVRSRLPSQKSGPINEPEAGVWKTIIKRPIVVFGWYNCREPLIYFLV